MLILAACGGGATGPDPAGEGSSPAGSASSPSAGHDGSCTPTAELPGGDVANAPEQDVDFPWNRDGPVVAAGFDFDRIISGGPPPDGIRPIDEPCFEPIAGGDAWLAPESPVLAVSIEGDSRAYPLSIMTQHEIVNDVVGGVPAVVTYCPLCNSGIAFERTVDGQVLDFGTSGRLFQSNLVMYDRQTKSLWVQFTGKAVVGEPFVETTLRRIPTSLLSWAQFKEAAPDGLVLSRDSFPGRSYGRNPYPGYDGNGDRFLFEGPRDSRLDANVRVTGLGEDGEAIAVTLPRLRADKVVEVEVGDRAVSVWWAPGQASALDAFTVDDGDDVGSTAAFVAVAPDGTALTFAPADDDPTAFVDEQTGTRWNMLGEGVDGPLAGEQLEAVPHDDTWWFVWFAFQPDTRVAAA